MGSKSFLSIAVGTLLLIPVSFAFATSGACSDHLGVNCAAGPQANGNVICNDGWLGSSVSYDSMEECQDDDTGGTSFCGVTPSEIDSSEATDYISSALSVAQEGLQGYQGGLNSALSEAQQMYQQEQQQDAQDLAPESTYGESALSSVLQNAKDDYDELVASAHLDYDANIASEQACVTYLSGLEGSTCQSSEGPDATFNSSQGECTCEAGYWLDSSDGQCETPTTVCTNTLGSNSHPVMNSNQQCVCNTNANNGGANYAIGSDGQCDPVQEPAHTISATAYSVASGGGSCRSLSGQDETDCDLYASHPYDYDWQVIQQSTSDANTTPTAPAPSITPPPASPITPSSPAPTVQTNNTTEVSKKPPANVQFQATSSAVASTSIIEQIAMPLQSSSSPSQGSSLLNFFANFFGWLHFF